jgi:hypothetical protein
MNGQISMNSKNIYVKFIFQIFFEKPNWLKIVNRNSPSMYANVETPLLESLRLP